MSHRLTMQLLMALAISCLSPLWSQTGKADYTKAYHDYSEVVAKLKSWAGNAQAKLIEIGTSAGGKKLYALQIAAKGSQAPELRQAIFLGANIAGNHQAGTEAALHFIEQLLDSKNQTAAKQIANHTFYVAPILNPDAHDRFFAMPRIHSQGSSGSLDRDRDGFTGEDGYNDLNNDGMITYMRIPSPTGRYMIDENQPLIMRRADAKKGEMGTHSYILEGDDDDGDGKFNEDAPTGINPAINFAHGFQFNNPSAGPWASTAPEAKAIMDFLLKRPQIALAVVYGHANYFLSPPRGSGGSVDTGNLKLEIPKEIAEYLGFDPDQKYSLDEIWEVAKDLPEVAQNNLTKEDVAQFLGVGPATKPTGDDLELLSHFADKYKKRLEDAKLDKDRKGKQDEAGGFSSWLYFQYGALTVELDVWGVPKAPEPKSEKKEDEGLTVDKLEKMSSEDFLALGEEKITQFLKDNKVPDQYSASTVMNMVSSGQVDPKRIAGMMKQMGLGAGGEKKTGKKDDLLVFAEEHAPWAIAQWSPVTLKDGRKAEVGGVERFLAINPPYELLKPAMKAHSETIMELVDNLPKTDILSAEVKTLGSNIYRIKVTAANKGFIPTHTGLAKKAKNHLPLRLGFAPNSPITILHGPKWATSEGLSGHEAGLSGEWLVRANGKATSLEVVLLSDNAGTARKTISLTGGVQ